MINSIILPRQRTSLVAITNLIHLQRHRHYQLLSSEKNKHMMRALITSSKAAAMVRQPIHACRRQTMTISYMNENYPLPLSHPRHFLFKIDTCFPLRTYSEHCFRFLSQHHVPPSGTCSLTVLVLSFDSPAFHSSSASLPFHSRPAAQQRSAQLASLVSLGRGRTLG